MINNSFIRSIPDDALLTPADISNITGLSTRQIRRYCEKGQLRSYCFGRKYVIYGVDFKSYMKESLVCHRTFKELLN
uniref:helix-turn-helix domain-containing protein n=1 Tax=Paenibacillus sp. FSL E2-0201 TaxID=2954726 RepID=UPI00403F5BCB